MSEETQEQPVTLQIIQPDNSALATAVVGSSWGDEEEEVKPRYIQLKQASSTALEQFPNGHFVDKEVGRTWATIEMVILHVRLSRRFQSPYDEKNPGPRTLYCRSVNRKTPITTDDRFTPPATDCNTCSYGQLAWANYDKKSGDGKPKNSCEQEVEILFIDSANPKQPYWYNIQGKNRSIAENMYTALKARSKDVDDRTGRRPELFEYIVTMTSVKEGKYYVPKFTEIRELKADEAQEKFGSAYKQFVEARQAAFAARQSAIAQAQNEDGQAQQTVVETPAQSAAAPAVNVAYLPPTTKRVVGAAVRPTYQAPATQESPAIEGQVVSNESAPQL